MYLLSQSEFIAWGISFVAVGFAGGYFFKKCIDVDQDNNIKDMMTELKEKLDNADHLRERSIKNLSDLKNAVNKIVVLENVLKNSLPLELYILVTEECKQKLSETELLGKDAS